jgi:hypothetical protein
MNGLILDLSALAGLVCHADDISNTKSVPRNLDCAFVEEVRSHGIVVHRLSGFYRRANLAPSF